MTFMSPFWHFLYVEQYVGLMEGKNDLYFSMKIPNLIMVISNNVLTQTYV